VILSAAPRELLHRHPRPTARAPVQAPFNDDGSIRDEYLSPYYVAGHSLTSGIGTDVFYALSGPLLGNWDPIKERGIVLA
jgi:hypothetical protein